MTSTSTRTGSTIAVGDRFLSYGWTVLVTEILSRSSHSTIVRTSDGGSAVIGARHQIDLVA